MTFSLAGRCARTGLLGAVVTTSSMAVGSRCCFASAGVGAVLTQHRTDPRLGPLALELLARGMKPDAAMKAIVAGSDGIDWRQLAIVDYRGNTAVFSGAHMRPEFGQVCGRDCAAIANIVRTDKVPEAMVEAFEAAPEGHLADRLIAALAAGEASGGEFGPVTSAALLVVDKQAFPYIDLRVDDHPAPITELGRLWDAYRPECDAYVIRAVDPENATRPAGMVDPIAKT